MGTASNERADLVCEEAVQLMKQGKLLQPRRLLEASLRDHPLHLPTRIALVELSIREGHTEQATREARTATTLGISGSIRSAAALVHSVWLSQGIDPVIVEGNAIDLTEGYPDSTDIAATLADMTGFTVTVNGTNDQAVFTKNGASGPCQVSYSDALVNSAPLIAVDVSGC